MTGVTDPYATLTFTYDKDGRVVTMATSGPGTGQPTVTLTYSYDQLGDETSVTDSLSNQGVISYAYNAESADHQHHAVVRRHGRPAGDVRLRLREPADLDLAADRHEQHGDPGEHDDHLRRRQPGRDHDGRRVRLPRLPAGATTPLATQVYSYDNASRVTTETDAEGTASFTYDNANELTGVTGSRTESYSYDLNGNRTGTGYTRP